MPPESRQIPRSDADLIGCSRTEPEEFTELFRRHALHIQRYVIRRQHITDAAGNQDVKFTFPAHDGVTGILVNATLLDKGDVQYEGYIRNGQQSLVLNQAPVSGPGVRLAR